MLKTTTYPDCINVKCPHCSAKSLRVDHLICAAIKEDKEFYSAEDYGCDECGKAAMMKVYANGSVEIEKGDDRVTRRKKRVLLVIPPRRYPVFLTMPSMEYLYKENGKFPDFKDDKDDSYYINSHTCPTNWLSDLDGVMLCDDNDPHGFAAFVREVPAGDVLLDSDGVSIEKPEIDDYFPELKTPEGRHAALMQAFARDYAHVIPDMDGAVYTPEHGGGKVAQLEAPSFPSWDTVLPLEIFRASTGVVESDGIKRVVVSDWNLPAPAIVDAVGMLVSPADIAPTVGLEGAFTLEELLCIIAKHPDIQKKIKE